MKIHNERCATLKFSLSMKCEFVISNRAPTSHEYELRIEQEIRMINTTHPIDRLRGRFVIKPKVRC